MHPDRGRHGGAFVKADAFASNQQLPRWLARAGKTDLRLPLFLYRIRRFHMQKVRIFREQGEIDVISYERKIA